jgi:hypothetical protein
VLSQIRAEDMRAIERAQHRVGSDFHSSLPRSLRPSSFRVTCYVEIVAAARFEPSRGAASGGLFGTGFGGGGFGGVYVAYELVVPKGSGWRLLPGCDVPAGGARHAAASSSSSAFPAAGDGDDDGGDGDRDPYLEAGEEADRAALAALRGDAAAVGGATDGEGETDALLGGRRRGSTSAATNRRRGKGGMGGAGLSSRTSGTAAAAAAAAAADAAADPDRRTDRRWLRPTSVAGITQVARFVRRPWTFGSPSASVPSGARPAGAGQQSQGTTGVATDLFFAPPAGLASDAHGAGLAPRHPFGFSNEDAPLPGHARVRGRATGFGSTRGGARSEGMGSVSLVASVADGAYGSAGAVSGTAPPGGVAAGFDVVAIPEAARVPVAHIGYPLEVHLLYDSSEAEGEGGTGGEGTAGPSPPTLFLSVFSRDGWDRHSAEGYGFVDLPLTPGSRDVNASCWRPKGTPEQQEADFFLGGATRLADVTYARIPSDWQPGKDSGVEPPPGGDGGREEEEEEEDGAGGGARGGGLGVADLVRAAQRQATLSRYGFVTETTGEVGLRLHTVVQRPKGGGPTAAMLAAAAAFASAGAAAAGTAGGGAGAAGAATPFGFGGAAGPASPAAGLASATPMRGSTRGGGFSTTVGGGGGGGRVPLTVEQIIADAKALRRADRAMREERGRERGEAGARSPPLPGKLSPGGAEEVGGVERR